jgi:hypothetical protein
MIRRSFLTRTLGVIAGAVCAPFIVKAEPKLFASRVGDPALWDMGRNSGRTTRALRRAITSASRGETIAYIALDFQEAGRCKELAMSLCDGGGIAYSPLKPFVLDFGKGKIVFAAARSRSYKGCRCHLATIDHAVKERLTPEEMSELCRSLTHSSDRVLPTC